MIIRPYRGDDEARLIGLWNAAMTHDRIDEAAWRTRVLLDPNFSPDGLILCEAAGRLRGFILSVARQVPLFLQGLEPELGWITAFGVHPDDRRQGIGRKLLDAALGRLAGMGRKRVLISAYTPNYFIPGVDVQAYPEAAAFLRAAGWEIVSTPISMHAELTDLQIPAEIRELEQQLGREGITVRPVRPADLPELMSFIAAEFGWDWFRFAQEHLLELYGPGSDEICFLVAVQGERVAGYCQQRRERLGPFGVAPGMRNKGIGRLLLYHCLEAMLAKGFHCAWFLWTGRDAARLYERTGFRQARQFAVMSKTL